MTMCKKAINESLKPRHRWSQRSTQINWTQLSYSRDSDFAIVVSTHYYYYYFAGTAVCYSARRACLYATLRT